MGLLIEILTIGVLTLACLGCIFLAAFRRLWIDPPKISITVRCPIYMPPFEFVVPENIKIQLQKVLPIQETDKPTDEPIPEEILEYCEQESDDWARNARKLRVRALKREYGDWDAAFRALQREDNPA